MKKLILFLLIIPAMTSCLHQEQIFPEKKKETVTTSKEVNLAGKEYSYTVPNCTGDFGIGSCGGFISFDTDTKASGVMYGDIALIYSYKVSGNIITLNYENGTVATTFFIKSNEIIIEKPSGQVFTLETPVK